METESVMLDINNKLSKQEELMNRFESCFTGMEQRIVSRIKQERKILQEELNASVDTITRKLNNIEERIQLQENGDSHIYAGISDNGLAEPVETVDRTGNISDIIKQHLDKSRQDHKTDMNAMKVEIIDKIQSDFSESISNLTTNVEKGIGTSIKSELADLKINLDKNQEDMKRNLEDSKTLNDTGLKEISNVQETWSLLLNRMEKQYNNFDSREEQVQQKVLENMEALLDKKMNELNTVIHESVSVSERNTIEEINVRKQEMVDRVGVSVDSKLQCLYRDLTDVIEKEAVLITEKGQITTLNERGTYTCCFRVVDFKKRTGSGVKLWSCPWYLEMLGTSMKGYVEFDQDGNVEVRLTPGRNPKIVGLKSKQVKPFKCQIAIINEKGGQEKILKMTSESRFEESDQDVTGDRWGTIAGRCMCKELVKDNLIDRDTMLIRYTFTREFRNP